MHTFHLDGLIVSHLYVHVPRYIRHLTAEIALAYSDRDEEEGEDKPKKVSAIVIVSFHWLSGDR
jgi:hypothetical protein